jgi:hypothetical protein
MPTRHVPTNAAVSVDGIVILKVRIAAPPVHGTAAYRATDLDAVWVA